MLGNLGTFLGIWGVRAPKVDLDEDLYDLSEDCTNFLGSGALVVSTVNFEETGLMWDLGGDDGRVLYEEDVLYEEVLKERAGSTYLIGSTYFVSSINFCDNGNGVSL